ncbi:hypothetical protein [Paenibacillus sp. YN15]|uniref:hypothetical protein n=1 Tax=Paenibacillus sp. YN15 TaxID=1742774 RepID=UPI0011BF518B|nr:hypothetical protein [Paenibacillus sp. YN15]
MIIWPSWSGQEKQSGWQLSDFTVEYWDGAEWQTAAAVVNNWKDGCAGQYNDLTFPAVATDRIRLYITKGNSKTDNRARVFELEIWASPAP